MTVLFRFLLVFVAVGLAATAVPAQSLGDALWSVPLQPSVGATHSSPAVGPDGTIYVMMKDLFAVAPDGTLRWQAPVQSLSVSAVAVSGGRVFVSDDDGTEKFVVAYDAGSGAEVWRTEIEATSSVYYGPSVGPDGNVYGVVGGLTSGLGAFSVAPESGTLRWNTQGFTDEGVRVKAFDVPFGSDRWFVADRGVPCSPAGWGTVGLSFEGDVLWCVPGLVQERPDVGPGDVLYGIGFNVLTKFSPDGEVLWQFPFPPPVEPLEAPTVGPDGAVYVAESNGLWAFEPDGNVRFHVDDGLASAVGRVSVTDGGTVLHPFGGNASGVAALDGATGDELWRVALPFAPDGPFAFSPNGDVAYVARRGGAGAPSELIAIYLGDASATANTPSGTTASSAMLSMPAPNPFAERATFELTLGAAVDVRVEVFDVLGRRVRLLHEGALGAGAHAFSVEAAGLPAGVYVVRAAGAAFAEARRLTLVR